MVKIHPTKKKPQRGDTQQPKGKTHGKKSIPQKRKALKGRYITAMGKAHG
jgi:hypothetical protein